MMRIEIELSRAEGLEIIIKHCQSMFPGKIITGDIGYGDIKLTVSEPESEVGKEETV